MRKYIDMTWSDFEIILAISESKTLTAAAKRLGVNQSTISRNLKRIEDGAGERLFSQFSGTYRLTPQGKPFLRVAAAMEKSARGLKIHVAPSSKVVGTIKISTVEALGSYLLARIEPFKTDFPQISIELNASNERVSLPKRDFHGAIRLTREIGAKQLLIKKLGEFGVSAYQSRSKSSEDWIGFESKLSAIPEEKWLKKQRSKPTLRVSHYKAMERAIELGLGKGLLPHFIGENNPKLKRVSGFKATITRTIWFLTHPDTRRTPTMNAFSKWLFEQFSRDKTFFK